MSGTSPRGTARLSPYVRSPDFPPRAVERDDAALGDWFRDVFAAVPQKGADPSTTNAERRLYRMSATEYVQARKDGTVTCEAYCAALVKRARWYRYLNQWIFTTYDRLDLLVAQARALDAKAAAEGVDGIAPLYGLPIPMKGTAAVVDYPSGCGVGVLSAYTPIRDSHLTLLIKERHGLIFGCTNVPEFAASWSTRNPASGQTRSVYNHRYTVGGSSGGAASAVAAYMCALAVTEDTGGSTRVPALCNQNFGFDPSRNHYNNKGNPGLTPTNDQLGLNARSVDDIIFYDRCLATPKVLALHDEARRKVLRTPAGRIRIGVPRLPFVDCVLGPGLLKANHTLSAEVRHKYEEAREVIKEAGFAVVEEEWRQSYFDYLGRHENTLVEAMYCGRRVNGKAYRTAAALMSVSGGQASQFVAHYLDAPVSLKEIIADCSRDPSFNLAPGGSPGETALRHAMGPRTRKDCEVYNSYFDQANVDLILIPAAPTATPDLESLARGTVPIARVSGDGSVRTEENGGQSDCFGHMSDLKHLHIPKMVVPTGLTPDGRPTAVQLWGRAVPYDLMFDDEYSATHDVEFLCLVQRVAAAIQLDPQLRRVDAPLVTRDLLPGANASKL